MPRTVRVSSRALGHRAHVRVVIYDTTDELRHAAQAYNGTPIPGAVGVTQRGAGDSLAECPITVRLARTHLSTLVVSHEIHHAATAIYGAHLGERISRDAHLNHFNEPFAHLYSDLLARLVDRLYSLGYYGR